MDKIKRRQTHEIIGFENFGKVQPQAIEFEEAILGAIMLEKGAYEIAASILKPESFYKDAHMRIFKAFQFLDNNQQPIDLLTTVEALRISDDLEMIGGPYFVSKLTNAVVSSANIETHARIVLEKYIIREMIRLSGETISAAFESSTDFVELMEQHEKTLSLITTGNIKNNISGTLEVGAEEINRLYYLKDNPTNLTGVSTGYSILNHLTGGWQPTDLIILAGRPSVGKTAIALNFIRNAALTVPVGMFSLEMSKNQLMRRLLCAESMVYLDKLNNGKLTDKELDQVVMANSRINNMKIFIDDTGGMDIYELRSKARKMVNKHSVKLIVVDYLQLMNGTGNKTQNREQEISTISRSLKSLAKELKVPIIALSQMSRDIEKRKGEPQLSDLRESGAIEQDADMVLFGWRDDYQVTDGEANNTAYIKVAKNRNGALDKLAFRTDMRVQTWFDLSGWAVYEREMKPF